jgi:hypothetical protein
LAERVVDIGIRAGGRANHADFRQGRNSPAHSVELAAVRIGTAERGEKNPIARGTLPRKISALLVPPRMKTARTAICLMDKLAASLSLVRVISGGGPGDPAEDCTRHQA